MTASKITNASLEFATKKGLRFVLGSSSKWRRAIFEKHFESELYRVPDIDEKSIRHTEVRGEINILQLVSTCFNSLTYLLTWRKAVRPVMQKEKVKLETGKTDGGTGRVHRANGSTAYAW
jgi:hypothetical protein